MQASVKWLKDYVDIDVTPQELAGLLTMAGFEVEALSPRRPSFAGIVTAEILAISPHPRADNLSLCEVSTGKSSWRVVCGAKNIFAGARVPLAGEGARLGSSVISSQKIREVLSQGMLCSEAELGIGGDASGILILPDDTPPGLPLEDYLGLEDEIFEVNVTPNRPDCLSVLGLAREVAALTGKKLRYPAFLLDEDEKDIGETAAVEIHDPELCPRYCARLITGLKVGPSPLWLRRRLEAAGLRAINNIVDVTNYVMLELGQPLHAFDFNLISAGRIVVRRARAGEVFQTLDGKERPLKPETLLICDAEKPVAIAGIMGGMNSEVFPETETVLLESACFNPRSIRRSAKYLGMNTDASFRFERGVDIEGVVGALNRAAQMIAELGEGRIRRNYLDSYPGKPSGPLAIPLRLKKVRETLGIGIDGQEIADILRRLEIDVREDEEKSGCFLVTPPSFRLDLTREIDLIEEIARVFGYDRIPTTLPEIAVKTEDKDPLARALKKIREVLLGCGYTEVINYSFIPAGALDDLKVDRDDPRRRLVKISNPLTEEQSVMRSTLVHSLLSNYRRNINTGIRDLKIFEMGRVFFKTEDGLLPREKNSLGVLLAGARFENRWPFSGEKADFYDLKGVVETIFSELKISGLSFSSAFREPFLHPGKSCGILINNRQAGRLGELIPEVGQTFDLKDCPLLLEMDLDLVAQAVPGEIGGRDISRFPSSIRDAAFILKKQQEAGSLIDSVLAMKEELVEEIAIFDLYEGPGIPENSKSLGLRFTYRSFERTLTDEEVNEIHFRLIRRITGETGVKVRGET